MRNIESHPGVVGPWWELESGQCTTCLRFVTFARSKYIARIECIYFARPATVHRSHSNRPSDGHHGPEALRKVKGLEF